MLIINFLQLFETKIVVGGEEENDGESSKRRGVTRLKYYKIKHTSTSDQLVI